MADVDYSGEQKLIVEADNEAIKFLERFIAVRLLQFGNSQICTKLWRPWTWPRLFDHRLEKAVLKIALIYCYRDAGKL